MNELDDGADLRVRMATTLIDLPTPTERLHAGSLARGRRLRRARTARTAAGSLVAAAATVAVVATMSGTGSPGTGDVAADTTPTPPPTERTAVPTDEQGAGWWDTPTEDLLATLRGVLPDDVTVVAHEAKVSDPAPGETGVVPGWLTATLESEDTDGPGNLQVILYPPEGTVTPGPVEVTHPDGSVETGVVPEAVPFAQRLACPAATLAAGTCEEIVADDGTPAGRAQTTQVGGLTLREVTLLGPDGGLLYAATANSVADKWGAGSPASATAPPLGLDELRAIAQDPAWTD